LRRERAFTTGKDMDQAQLHELLAFVLIISLANRIDSADFTYSGGEITRFCGRDSTE